MCGERERERAIDRHIDRQIGRYMQRSEGGLWVAATCVVPKCIKGHMCRPKCVAPMRVGPPEYCQDGTVTHLNYKNIIG